MKNKLIASYAVLITFMVLFMGIYSILSTQTVYHRDYQESMKKQALLLAGLLPEREGGYQSFAQSYGGQLGLRVTLIDRDGNVLADSSFDEALENHLGRPEVQRALSGQAGADTRYSSTAGAYYLYVAVPAEGGVLRLAKPAVDIEQTIGQIAAVALFGILLCAGFSAVMSVVFSRRIIRPLDQLNDAVNEVAQGNYGKKIYVDGRGQVATLASSFNVMNKILEFNVNQLAEQNVKLTSMLNSMTEGVLAVDMKFHLILTNPAAHRIFGLPDQRQLAGKNIYGLLRDEAFYHLLEDVMQSKKSGARELEWASPGGGRMLRFHASPVFRQEGEQLGVLFVVEDVTQIRRLEQMRTDFVSNVSHELKTPLTSIIGFVDTLQAGAVEDTETARRFLDIIGQESDRLYRLLQDILTLSSIESADQDVGVGPVQLGEVARQIDQLLRPKAGEKQLAFEIRVEDNLPPFPCNRDRISQMLINLIENAVKYTEHGSVITTVAKRGGSLEISVADTGIGIPADQLDRVFERFYRVDKGRSRRMGGTGLGLSIVKHIVLLYQGQISVSSEVGRGSEFTITLPYRRSGEGASGRLDGK